VKIIRAKDIEVGKQIFLEKDSLDTCANYVEKLSNGDILIETLYRYSKPARKIMSVENFDLWREKIEN
jgi:hypothetical protein